MRLRLTGAAALVSAAALVVGLTHASAAPPDPKTKKQVVDSQVRRLRSDLDTSSRQLVLAEAAYNAVQAKMPAAEARLRRARSQLAAAEVQDQAMQRRLSLALAAERAAERDLRDVAADIADDRRLAGQMARTAYQDGPFAQLAVLMHARSVNDFTQRVVMVRSVLRSQNAALDRLRDVQGETRRREASLAARRAEADVQRQAAARTLVRTRKLARAAEAAQAAVADLVRERRAAVAAMQAQRAADLAQYRELLAEQKRLAELIRKTPPAAGPGESVPQDHFLSKPAEGPITSPFGMRYHPILHVYKLHTGTDFGVPSGTTVRAAADGKVISAEFNKAYGNRVIVSHGTVNGKSLTTTYNHLTRDTVSVGEQVKRGEQVGVSGETGYATGPHLHFEVLVAGDFVDPETWL